MKDKKINVTFITEYNMNILCLQGTKVSMQQKIQLKNCNLLSSKSKHYGLGFVVSKNLDRVCIKNVSYRLTTLEGSTKSSSIQVLNCSEPTQVLCNKNKKAYDEFKNNSRNSSKQKKIIYY